ncbi:MAG: hypothetical protein ACK55I_11300, partial [bacterium]
CVFEHFFVCLPARSGQMDLYQFAVIDDRIAIDLPARDHGLEIKLIDLGHVGGKRTEQRRSDQQGQYDGIQPIDIELRSLTG